MISLLIVDDHEVVRTGIGVLIATADDVVVVGEARDGLEALDLAATLRPDVVLMDLEMPRMGGVEATRRLGERAPDTRVVVLSAYSDDDLVLSAIEAGAVGYLLKDAHPDEVLRGIRAAAAGQSPLAPKAARAIVAAHVAAHVAVQNPVNGR